MKTLITLFLFASTIIGCRIFEEGSYPDAEIYKYNLTSDSLINLLISLKVKDSTLWPPANLQLPDGKPKAADSQYWFNFYFYDKSNNQIFFTWVRIDSNNPAEIGLVRVNEGLVLGGHWKTINRDYSTKENDIKKDEFNKLIISKINAKIIK